MTQYDDTNKGVLFKNERREKDTHPNLKGQINVDGKEYWLSAWTKEVQRGERSGQKMLSIAINPKEQSSDDRAASTVSAQADDDSDLPF